MKIAPSKISNQKKPHLPKKQTVRSFPLWKTAAAIAGIGIVALGLLRSGAIQGNINSIVPIARNQIPLSYASPDFCRLPNWLDSYKGENWVKMDPIPMPPQESLLMHPQLVFLTDGNGYMIHNTELRKNHKDRLRMIDEIYDGSKLDPGFHKEVSMARTKDERGVQKAGVNQHKALFGVNPQKIENYEKAGKLLEEAMNNSPQLSAKKICQKLLAAQKALYAGINVDFKKTETPGMYRNQLPIVFRSIPGVKGEGADKLIEIIRRRGSDEDVRIFTQELLPVFLQNNYWKRKDLTENQLKVMQLLGHIPPDSEEIPGLMQKFAENFKTLAIQMKECEDFDLIAFAAWAHHQIVDLHPFIDGNGRIARLLMNTILRKGGYQPVVFPNREEYANAVLENQKNPGYFATFLREKAIPWNREQFDPALPCLDKLTC